MTLDFKPNNVDVDALENGFLVTYRDRSYKTARFSFETWDEVITSLNMITIAVDKDSD